MGIFTRSMRAGAICLLVLGCAIPAVAASSGAEPAVAKGSVVGENDVLVQYQAGPETGGNALTRIKARLAGMNACGTHDAAIRGTRERLAHAEELVPETGRAILVNIAGQQLYAYEDGQLVLQSNVVVGSPSWKTPEMETRLSYLRLNPTWTVPQSIIGYRGWRDKVRNDPSYFSRQNFLVVTESGVTITPAQAASSGASIRTLVQQPGASNALGVVKFGLHNGGAIYMHDTNAPALFSEANRARSHGCIRVERALDLAAWIMGVERSDIDSMIAANDRKNRTDFPEVKVVLGYWTAWEEPDGQLAFYRDIYNKDPAGRSCLFTYRGGDVMPPSRPAEITALSLPSDQLPVN